MLTDPNPVTWSNKSRQSRKFSCTTTNQHCIARCFFTKTMSVQQLIRTVLSYSTPLPSTEKSVAHLPRKRVTINSLW